MTGFDKTILLGMLCGMTAVMSLAVSCETVLINIPTGITVSEAEVSSLSGTQTVSVKTSGDWVLDLNFAGGEEPWAELSKTEGRGSEDVVLNYEENAGSESRTVRILLTTSEGDYMASMTQAAKSSGGDPDPDPDPDPDDPDTEPSENPGWIELPAFSETEDCHFYWHDMTLKSGKHSRNYSFFWDRENLVAHWVAYPLNDGLIGSGKRTDDWDYDPKVPRDEQPCLFKGYDGGYDRGHQLPSADRYTDNPSTFYFTNMTPQLGGLNQKTWADFEIDVRDWAGSADTLYVVTGCLLEGSLGKAYDNNGKAVTVPGAYFKALLWYKASSTYSFGSWTAAGFYFEHRSGASRQIMSIDELEERTGIDFFVNLPSRAGKTTADKVEAAKPGSFWN